MQMDAREQELLCRAAAAADRIAALERRSDSRIDLP
jgi:hypothetical protein